MTLLKLLATIFVLTLPSFAYPEEIVINAVGDIMLGGRGTATFTRRGYDYPFLGTAVVLKKGDITVGNLEAPLTRGGTEFTGKKFRFRIDPRAAGALKRAGFSVLTLANNHMLDFGGTGLEETLYHLDRHGISHAGAGEDLSAARREALVTVRGKKIAFLAYSLTFPQEFYADAHRAGTAPGYRPFYEEDIARVRTLADYVVVSFHWGAERSSIPKPYQVDAAHGAIDAGADLVLGHHPHVLQGIERYNQGLILYSLGNFAFGCMSSGADRSVIARITLDDGVKEVELVPLNVLNSRVRFQPKVVTGKDGKEVIDHLDGISRTMGTSIVNEGGRYLVRLEHSRRIARE